MRYIDHAAIAKTEDYHWTIIFHQPEDITLWFLHFVQNAKKMAS
jgi:hypothetical protein